LVLMSPFFVASSVLISLSFPSPIRLTWRESVS
jgi:hypothetical protein